MKHSFKTALFTLTLVSLTGCALFNSSISSSLDSSSVSSSSTSSSDTSSSSVSSSSSTQLETSVESVYYDISNDYTTIYNTVNPSVAVLFVYSGASLADQGSAFVYDVDGTTKYAIANYSVARAAQSPTAVDINTLNHELLFGNNVRVAADLVGFYSGYDIAVLRFEDPSNLVPVAPLGTFDGKSRGEEVLVIGTPKVGPELRNTLTRGVVSGLERMVTGGNGDYAYSYPAFQIDAPTNTGVFGGPVIDITGAIIGVVQYRYLDVDGISESISFAISIDDLSEILDQIVSTTAHTYSKVRIGVTVQDIRMMDLATRTSFNIPAGVTSGLYVVEAGVGTPAYNAGIRSQDIITTADGFPVSSLSGLSSYLYRKAIGETFVLQVYGEGTVNVVLTSAA